MTPTKHSRPGESRGDLASQYAMLTAEADRAPIRYIAGNWALDNGCRDPPSGATRTHRSSVGLLRFHFRYSLGSRSQPRKTNYIRG